MKRLVLSTFLIFSCFFFSTANENTISAYFAHANLQMKQYNPPRKDYVIIIDYRKSIISDRLYVLDMKNNHVVLSSNVSHAWNTGAMYARKFSNELGSNTSCKGNFLTRGTKYGKYGYSMVIKGLDQGINDKALSRAIIFHSDAKMKTKWSWGCFATPEKINKQIIDLTKNGVLVCVMV
jgi:hypothetical protein